MYFFAKGNFNILNENPLCVGRQVAFNVLWNWFQPRNTIKELMFVSSHEGTFKFHGENVWTPRSEIWYETKLTVLDPRRVLRLSLGQQDEDEPI